MNDFNQTATTQALGTDIPPVAVQLDRTELINEESAGLTDCPAVPGYEIIRELGRGGMGVVYLARHTKLQRQVALKMILGRGLAGREALARFEQEAATVAALQHRNIVQIYEFGIFQNLPFIALEFCDGGSLERLVRDVPQDPRFVAGIVEQIADALVAVHEKKIIHRDLKPENILLSGNVPRLTDFGLARHGDTTLTQTGQVMGTPAYMAPEQAWGNRHQLGPPADLWALGAILYRLLTGRVPFRAATIPETIRLVIEVDPVPIRLLVPTCPRDLETITLKCLQKDPRNRYASAAALRDDLRAWLDGKPISARPIGPIERVLKWTKRRPVIAGLTGLLAASVLGLIFLTAWALQERQRSRQNEVLAQTNAWQAELNAEQAARAADKAREDRSFALQALDAMTDEFIINRLETAQRLSDDELAFMQKVAGFYERFAHQAGETLESRREQAEGLRKVALIQARLGKTREALRNYETSRDLQLQLLEQQPKSTSLRLSLARTRNNLGLLYSEGGKGQLAEAELLAACGLAKALTKEFPNNNAYRLSLAQFQQSLAALYRAAGRSQLAETECLQSLESLKRLTEEQPANLTYQKNLAKAHNNLDLLYRSTGRLAEAETHCLSARVIQSRLLRQLPNDTDNMQDLARTHANLGTLYRAEGRTKLAETEYLAARDLSAKLASQYPGVTDYRQDLARRHLLLGNFYRAMNRLPEAERELTVAKQTIQALVAEHPSRSGYRHDLARTHIGLGLLHRQNNAALQAEKEYAAACDVLQRLAVEQPLAVDILADLATSQMNLGSTLKHLGKISAAIAAQTSAKDVLSRLSKAHPNIPEYRQSLARAHFNIGNYFEAQGNLAATESEWRAALDLQISLVRDYPKIRGYRNDLAFSHTSLARLAATRFGQSGEAKWVERAIEHLREAWRLGALDSTKLSEMVGLVPIRERSEYWQLLMQMQASERERLTIPPRIVRE